MRLAHVRLERYGPFEQLDLPLDPTPGRVNLIVAPNGYGKSVIRHALGAFLFGIETRTPMTFRFGAERMRLLADIIHDGTTLSLVRRKGNGNTLATTDGADIAPAQQTRLLGGANETVFRELFGLDTGLLRSGGNDLIRSQGRLGQVLFAAGGGMARVRDLLTELERKRDELGRATVKHKARPLWAAFSAWEKASSDLRTAALRPDNWRAMERHASETAETLRILLDEQTTETQERERLRTIGACRPWLDRLHAAAQTLAEAHDAPDLDDSFEKRWRDALEEGAKCLSAAQAASAELDLAQQSRADLTFDPAWVEAEVDIKALVDLRAVALGAETDLPQVEREQQTERSRAAALRQDLGYPETLPLPSAQLVRNAQKCLQQQPKLASEATAAQDRLIAATSDHESTTTALADLPPLTDTATIVALADLLRRDGDPAARLQAAQGKLRQADSALHAALAAIPDSSLSETTLTTTAAPSEPTLEAAGKALGDAEAAHDRAIRDLHARSTTIERERTALAALERAAMLPPQHALANARAHRDALWSNLLTPTPDPATAVALDRAMRDADGIADALIAHGKEAARAAALRESLMTLDAEKTGDHAAVARTAAAVADARTALIAVAQAAGGTADDIQTLRAFLRARDTAVTCHLARETAAAERTATETDLRTIGHQLATALTRPLPDLTSINVLLAEADRHIEADRNLTAQRKTLTEHAARQRLAQANAATAAAKANKAIAEWTAQWAPVAVALARPADETPAATADALLRIDELRNAERGAADKQGRIDAMRTAIALLATRVARLSDLSAAIAALPPIEAAEAFRQRLQVELQQAARCQDADQRIAQARTKHTQSAAAAEAAARTRSGLRAALHADSDEAAERQIQRARAAAAARADSTEATRQLATQGGGLSVESLAVRAAESTPDADTARIAAIDAAHAARLPLIDTARSVAAEAAAARDHAGTGLDAAEAAQRREAAQASLARTAEEALLLHATHALLQAALDRQARTADQPLLTRIGEVFRTITGGAQAGVRIEDTKDGQTMVALESDGIARKSLDQLSEGTSDQLYLALRVAALEDYATTASPLPFIADDILQTFDDGRTVATLHALAALSTRVQVIVLTHHRHVGVLAAGLPAGTVRVIPLEI